jgi:hypothetical protein
VDTLDWLLILGRRHLERTPRSDTTQCNRERSHRGLGLLTPEPADTAGQRRRSSSGPGTQLIARLLDPDEAGAEVATIGPAGSNVATRSLFLDDRGALFGLCDRVGCGLGLLPAGVVFGLAFAVVDVPHVVLLVDPDR